MEEKVELPKPTTPPIETSDITSRFRLYMRPTSLCCKFFEEELTKYPAVNSYLEVWDITDRPAPHNLGGIPCIVDLQSSKEMWLGSAALAWLRVAVVRSACSVATKIPHESELKLKYSFNSSSIDSSPSSSETLDTNQEDSTEELEKNKTEVIPVAGVESK